MKKSFKVSFPGTKKQNFLPCNVHRFCVKWRPPFGEILWRIAKMPGSYHSGGSIPRSIQIAQNARKKMRRTGVVTRRKECTTLILTFSNQTAWVLLSKGRQVLCFSASLSCVQLWTANNKAEVGLMTESQIDCVIPQLQMNPVFGWLPCNSVRGWHSLRLV